MPYILLIINKQGQRTCSIMVLHIAVPYEKMVRFLPCPLVRNKCAISEMISRLYNQREVLDLSSR